MGPFWAKRSPFWGPRTQDKLIILQQFVDKVFDIFSIIFLPWYFVANNIVSTLRVVSRADQGSPQCWCAWRGKLYFYADYWKLHLYEYMLIISWLCWLLALQKSALSRLIISYCPQKLGGCVAACYIGKNIWLYSNVFMALFPRYNSYYIADHL